VMRLLLVADSHGRGMGSVVHRLDDSWMVMTVRVSGQTQDVKDRYLERLSEVRQFNPEAVILHVGHNNFSYHSYHNPDPDHVKEFFPSILEFVALLQGNHPRAKVVYSSVFPRSTGPRLTDGERHSYNKVASRYGCLTQSTCKKEGINFVLNGALWLSVRKAKENPTFFMEDGLHLLSSGQKIVARDWIKAVAGVGL
jgi:lysophospholipase L1-like esterase